MGGGASPSSPTGMPQTSTCWPTAACRSRAAAHTAGRRLRPDRERRLVPLEPGQAVEELLARADLAVRAAASRAGAPRCGTAALGDAAARRARLRERPARRLGPRRADLLFQPVVSLEEQRITGVEALLRWRHPELGEVPPAEFVPIADRAGLLGELQRWALEEAATAARQPARGRRAAARRRQHAGRLRSPPAPSWPTSRRRCATGLAPERLVLEITEATVPADDERSASTSHAAAHGRARRARRLRHRPSALAHLTRLPIDVLKLDRSLVSRIDRDPQSRALCESIIAIGRALGLDVVAEGVETPAQLGAVRLGLRLRAGLPALPPHAARRLTRLLSDGAGVAVAGPRRHR